MDLNQKETAQLLNISHATLERWIHVGSLPSYQIGGESRFNRREIEDWLIENCREERLHSGVLYY